MPTVDSHEVLASLARRAAAGDAAAFAELYERTSERVWRVAWRLAPKGSAEDVVQEAYLVAWKNIGRLRDAERVFVWLRRIARFTALKRRAREARERERVVSLDGEPTDASAFSQEADTRLDLQSTLKHFDPKLVEIVLLRYMDELPLRMIAQRLGMTLHEVRKVLERVPARIAQRLIGY